MATKNNPGAFQCYQAALPDEEIFTILGRDLAGPATLEFWAAERERLGLVVTEDDKKRIAAALTEANKMRCWRAKAMLDAEENGEEPVWRQPRQIMDDGPPICIGQMADPITIKQALHDLLELENSPSAVRSEGAQANHAKKVKMIGMMIDAIEAETEYVMTPFEVQEVAPFQVPSLIQGQIIDELAEVQGMIRNLHTPRGDPVFHRIERIREVVSQLPNPRPPEGSNCDLPPGGLPFTTADLEEFWVCQVEGFRVWRDDEGVLWFSQAINAHRNDWSGAYRINNSLLREIIKAMFERIRDDEQVIDDTQRGPTEDRPVAEDDDALIARLEHVVEQLRIVDTPKPYDLYLAVKREDAFGWSYRAVGFGLSDLEGLVNLLERNRPRRKVGKHPALAMPYGLDAEKLVKQDDVYQQFADELNTAPEDLAHAPEVPPHRFSTFVKHGRWAYARGLEVNPSHLPRALEAMSLDGWHLVSLFGATDSQNVGFIFERRGAAASDLVRRFREAYPPPPSVRADFFASLHENEKTVAEVMAGEDPKLDLGRQQEP